VLQKDTNVSDDHAASIFRVETSPPWKHQLSLIYFVQVET